MATSEKDKKVLRRLIALLMVVTTLLTAALLLIIVDTYLGLPFIQSADGTALIYAFPEGIASSKTCVVEVNGQKSFVHETLVNYHV